MRLMSRPKVLPAALVVGVTALLAPVAAQAATTYTVDAGAPAGCSAGNVCKTIGEANARVADGDTVSINPGTYTEAVTVLRQNVTFVALMPGRVTVVAPAPASGSAPAPTFTLGNGTATAGKGTVLRGLVVSSGASGGSAVSVQTTDTVVDASTLTRPQTTTDAPAYVVEDAGTGITGGINTIAASFITDVPGLAEAGSQPAVLGGGETSLIVRATTIIVGDKAGSGIRLVGNSASADATPVPVPNQVTGGGVYTLKAAANAIEVVSATSPGKATLVDSMVLSPGTGGAGLTASSSGTGTGATTVTARHVTIAGGAKPFALAAAATGGTGDVTVDADRSILHGAGKSTLSVVAPVPVPLLGDLIEPGNSATLTETVSDTVDATAAAGEAKTTVSSSTNTPDAALFTDVARRDLHLKPSAPVIDKGGPAVDGESPVDFEGQGRVAGAASDLGGDEFVNLGPIATIRASNATPRQNEIVTFDASGSRDREPSGSIAMYAFDFGDGTPVVVSATPSVRHAFANVGSFVVRVGVVDGLGAPAIAATSVTVSDGTPPTIKVAKPKAGATFKAYSVKKVPVKVKKGAKKRFRTVKTLRKITFSGTASDSAGVKFVELAIRRVGKSTKSCVFLDHKARKFVSTGCRKPKFFVVRFEDGRFTYRLPRGPRYKAASHELLVRATDGSGVVARPAPVPFKLK